MHSCWWTSVCCPHCARIKCVELLLSECDVLYRNCSKNPTEEVVARVKEMGETFCTHYVQVSGTSTFVQLSPFKAWSRSVCSHTCYACCQGFIPYLFLPLRSIHLHFFQNLSWFLLYWLLLTHGSCVGSQNRIGHPAGCRFLCWVPAEYKSAKKNMTCGMMTCEMNNLETEWSLCSALM